MTTPARRQYLRIKQEHQDELLLFRMGDFYETFDEDAHTISRELEIALTSRGVDKGKKIPLAGIPYHSLDGYLARLIQKGYKVAICEQTSDPAPSKGIVDREVVRVVTPGTVMEEAILEKNTNNYMAALVIEGASAGLSYVDITTSEFATTEMPAKYLNSELERLAPSEVLVIEENLEIEQDTRITVMGMDPFDLNHAVNNLLRHFRTESLEAFGCHSKPLAIRASGAILDYLSSHNKVVLPLITSLHTYSTSSFMTLDPQTHRNLELFAGGRWSSSSASLLRVLDRTKTSMGGRLLKRWLAQPLLEVRKIHKRQQVISWFYRSDTRRGRISGLLTEVSDLERLINRVRSDASNPRDLTALKLTLEVVPQIVEVMSEDNEDKHNISWLVDDIADNSEIVSLVDKAIVDDPPLAVGNGNVIRSGFSLDLDRLRDSSASAKGYIVDLETKERERTGIKSLKVGYNRVFGYYIEISKSNLDQVPDDYIRRQTLVGGERFITPKMKEYESLVLSAQDQIEELESELFRQITHKVSNASLPIMETALAISQIDVFASLADVASREGYVRPEVNDGESIEINQGRHPVVERALLSGAFVPNDTTLSNSQNQLMVLTGPNMAGKSTFIRQVAVITLMAQVGSYVPAKSAKIGIVDRIFTRVGLQDDLAVGQSTFMVEMMETAAILNNATSRSLIVLDEIGRGTSTYDGLAIARSVAEYIHNQPRLGCKTLFATHYHELTKLAEILPRAHNFNVSVSDEEGRVVFLRRIVPGGADRSYGVHVASLAGMPRDIVTRAWEVLKDLEGSASTDKNLINRDLKNHTEITRQPELTGKMPKIMDDILALDISSLTPIEAINKLNELQQRSQNEL